MREACWLCRRRRRWVKTPDSDPGLTVSPNLLQQAGWRLLTGVDEAWIADLTDIRLPHGCCSLAAILDAYSRKVGGWERSEEVEAELVVAALQPAWEQRKPLAGWSPHSDRGVQYAYRE